MILPLFPLHTVLYPDGLLPLRIFEQRYIEMTKGRLNGETPFGVCLIIEGHEVIDATKDAPSAPLFAPIGTLATIAAWDMPQLGILHVRAVGGKRFQVHSHKLQSDGLVIGEVTPIADESPMALSATHRPLAALLDAMIQQLGAEHFAQKPALDNASWVSFRLAELLPLPLPIKQKMLEMNDSEARLAEIAQFLRQQGVL